jgi:nitrous oxidase accessory protein NosD
MGREVLVTATDQLRAALGDAQPGDVITLAPGSYRFDGRPLDVARGGRPDAPITLRAPQPGSVTLEFDLVEGFHLRAPHWIFENLSIVGVCPSDDDCEHAFHVVGAAQGVVIRNNDLRNFNAHIKINGADGALPDSGRIEGNRLTNSAPRATDAPVTPIDLVAASDWQIESNFIADFVKGGGNLISFGAFAKGGGFGNRFVRNVVLCEHRLRGAPGRRVSLSFGGGGTAPGVCRDKRCIVEHERGIMRDNLIVSCSDDGIYINRGAQTQLLHNTLRDTAGINVRFAQSAAFADGHLVDGTMAAREGAILHKGDNWSPALAWP